MGIAVAGPTLIAYNISPSATFLNQETAFVGWGAVLLLLSLALPPWRLMPSVGLSALLSALGAIALLALSGPVLSGLPMTIAMSGGLTLMVAMFVATVASYAVRCGIGDLVFSIFCLALAIAGEASSIIGFIQVFHPDWADGLWIAPTGLAGRAIGNLRQPNHLSSLLLWSCIAGVWIGERGSNKRRRLHVVKRAFRAQLILVSTTVIFMTASRTGFIGTGVLALWGLLDKRLSKEARISLGLIPLVYVLMSLCAWASASVGLQGVGVAARAVDSANITSSRIAIWSNAWQLLASHPWWGVGFGEFNFAWTLTPFPLRPNEFFDHTHDIVIQLLVELGWPLGLIVIGLLLRAAWSALKNALLDDPSSPDEAIKSCRSVAPTAPSMQRAAFMMVAMIGLHSLLEYPLWYAYFLLPTAFAFGLCLERPAAVDARLSAPLASGKTRPFVLASMAVLMATSLAMLDYMNVAAIFAPPRDSLPLAERIERGQHSVLFAHHADYAAATIAEHPSSAMGAFRRAPHFLLDARLLIAWAKALDETGELERARYLAQRVGEFESQEKEEFFAPCRALPAATNLPFQCTPPTRAFSFEDFR